MEQKTIKRSRMYSKYEPRAIGSHVPQIRLSGLWLDKAGFGIGEQIEIHIEYKKLIINAIV